MVYIEINEDLVCGYTYTLVEHVIKTGNTLSNMEGELKGDLFRKLNEKPEEESKLKGKLLDKLKEENTTEVYSEDWLMSQTIIQRDGGDRFEVKDIITQTSGTSGKRIVQLRSLEDGHSINKEFNELIEKVKTPGSAWSIKE